MDVTLTAQAEQFARDLATRAGTVDDLHAVLKAMMKSALESMLDAEMDVHLGRPAAGRPATPGGPAGPAAVAPAAPANRRNGHSKKTVVGELGDIPLDVPRDRLGSFEPQLLPRYQRRLPGFDDKILALYAKGLTARDIQDVVQDLYGVEVSATLVSEVTAALDAEVATWRTRRLDPVWPIVSFDGIVVHVRGWLLASNPGPPEHPIQGHGCGW